MVIDPRNEAQMVATMKRLKGGQRKDCDMVIALYGLFLETKARRTSFG